MPFRRIVIFAAAGAHNLGDEAIVLSEVAFLRERYPDARISVSTYDSASTLVPSEWGIRYFSYFPNGFRRKPVSNVFFFLRTAWEIFRADLVVIGGGGIFYDNEGQSFSKQVFEWRLRTGVARMFQKPIVFFGVGIDVSFSNTKALLSIFRGASAIMVRDEKSAETLSRIGLASKIVPDPAFLVPRVRSDANGWVGARESVVPKMGISLRKGYLKGGDESVRKIVGTVRKSGFEPFFLHHSFHPGNPETDDRAYLRALAEELDVPFTASIAESLDSYRNVSGVVAMRLHAGVLSFVNGIPCFVLSYSRKTDAFIARSGIRHFLPASEFDGREFETRFSEFASEALRAPIFALVEKCDKIREEARTTYEETFYGLERHQK